LPIRKTDIDMQGSFMMNKLEFSEIVQAVCQRPRMYTPYGTLAEVISYHEEAAHAAGVDDSIFWGLSGFHSWFEKELGYPNKNVRWEELLDCHSTDEEEMMKFAERYRAYAEYVSKSKKRGNDQEKNQAI
jgi:hypothetical protein